MSERRSLDERLDAQLAALPREAVPRRDLWPDVAARITTGADQRADDVWPRWWLSGWTQLAAACLLVVVTAVVTYQLTRPDPTALGTVAAQGPLDVPVVTLLPATPASFGQGAVLGAEYVEARSVLARTFEQRLAELSPATRSQVERNLADIQRASAELAAALDQHPASPLLQDLLVSTYQEELDLFSQINQMTATTMMRNDL
jgi:hypothetical protein